MAVARRRFFSGSGMDTGMSNDASQGGGGGQQPHQPQQGMMPAVPPPTDPNMAAQGGYGRGPTMPGNVQDLLTPQQDPNGGQGQGGDPYQGDENNPMAGSASVVMRLLKTLGKI